MSEKRVKIGKEFEHIPAVKSGRGWLGLEKGKFGRVRFESRSRKLELWIKQGAEWKRTLFPVEEYAKANEAARKANKIGEQAGASFGTLRKEEEAALKFWREYVLTKTQAGAPPRPLIDILREAVEREETKDETPLFKDVAFQFMEFKEQNGGSGLAYRNFIRLRLNKLSNHFKKFRLSEISAQALNEAILKIARPRNGAPPSLKTRKLGNDLVLLPSVYAQPILPTLLFKNSFFADLLIVGPLCRMTYSVHFFMRHPTNFTKNLRCTL